MFRILKNYALALIGLLFVSYYLSFFVTIGYQIYTVHKSLIIGDGVYQIKFGIITFITLAILPIILWKMASDAELPILKETLGLRLLLSEMAVVFTIVLFISKSIFNSVAKSIMYFDSGFFLDAKGRIVLIEILSIAVPLVIFLYFCKKVTSHFFKSMED